MSSFIDTFGAPAIVNLGGRDFKVGPITLQHLAAVGNEMRAGIHNPLPELMPLLQQMPQDLAVKLFQEASKAYSESLKVEPHDALSYSVDMPSGFALLLWLLLEDSYAGQFTRDQVFRLVLNTYCERPTDYGEMVSKVTEGSGLGFLGRAVVAAVTRNVVTTGSRTGPNVSGGSPTQSKPADEDSTPAPSAG